MEKINILILGSGGREHAFTWKLKQSPHAGKIFVAPGNPGTSSIATNLNFSEKDFKAIKAAIIDNNITLLVVGPEGPLVAGISDFIKSDPELKNTIVIGPGAKGAMLEGSKDFSKGFMDRHNIPTARYKSFSRETFEDAVRFLGELSPPYVLKADGLASGKGVIISPDIDSATRELREMLLNDKFGAAGNKVVIEEFLKGIELSVFILTDGDSYVILPEAKDYKRIGENDTGLNTGGMGAISPVPFATVSFMEKVEAKIIIPTISGLKKENIPYTGFIFVGIMKVDNEPFVIEYNARMGDPETEVVLPRIESDLLELFLAAGRGNLKDQSIKISSETFAGVVLVSGGYPEVFEKGKIINYRDEIKEGLIFHSGTTLNQNDELITNGGRVMVSVAGEESIGKAIEKAIENAQKVEFEDKYFRMDIGKDLLTGVWN